MGMDVYGKSPATEAGEYFRATVWFWHPLWEYCERSFPTITDKVEHGHSNSGDGLDADDSKALAEAIRASLADGSALEYSNQRNAYLAELERPTCDLCDGTGIRTDKIGVDAGFPTKALEPEQAIVLGRTHGWCNACHGDGAVDAWETNYLFDLEVLERFAGFLENCGGFEIC